MRTVEAVEQLAERRWCGHTTRPQVLMCILRSASREREHLMTGWVKLITDLKRSIVTLWGHLGNVVTKSSLFFFCKKKRCYLVDTQIFFDALSQTRNTTEAVMLPGHLQAFSIGNRNFRLFDKLESFSKVEPRASLGCMHKYNKNKKYQNMLHHGNVRQDWHLEKKLHRVSIRNKFATVIFLIRGYNYRIGYLVWKNAFPEISRGCTNISE